ncbi:hypothetical protein V7068_15375 [Bacillus sp. JJ634]
MGILITIQIIKTSERADAQIEAESRRLELQQYEEYQQKEFDRKVSPFKETFGGVWYPYESNPITNKDGVALTDYSIKLHFIDEINAEVEINYMEGNTPRTESLNINYHSDDNLAFLYEMVSYIESKDGNSHGGGRFEIKEPRKVYKDKVGCMDCKDFTFQIEAESKLTNFPNLTFVSGYYSRKQTLSKTDEPTTNQNVGTSEQDKVTTQESEPSAANQENASRELDSIGSVSQKEIQGDEQHNESSNEANLQASPLALKLDDLSGAWKRVTPNVNMTHDVQYIFIKRLDNIPTPTWRFTMETRNYLSTNDYSLTESELEFIENNQSIATMKRPDVNTGSEGFIIHATSTDTISVQQLNFSETEIVTEEFRRVSRDEIEEEFVGVYDVLIGK